MVRNKALSVLLLALALLPNAAFATTYDDEWPVYVFGDVESIFNVFNFVAMIANDGIAQTFMVVGAVVGLYFVAFKFRDGDLMGAFKHLAWIVAMTAFFLTPNATVHIVDKRVDKGFVKNTGTTYDKVDNVPIALAVAASTASAFSYTLTDVIDSAMAPIDEGVTVSGVGFGTPYDSLTQAMKIAQYAGESNSTIATYLNEMRAYMNQCLMNQVYADPSRMTHLVSPTVDIYEAIQPGNFGIVNETLEWKGSDVKCSDFYNDNVLTHKGDIEGAIFNRFAKSQSETLDIANIDGYSSALMKLIDKDGLNAIGTLKGNLLNARIANVVAQVLEDRGTGLTSIGIASGLTAEKSKQSMMVEGLASMSWMSKIVPMAVHFIFALLLALYVPMAIVAMMMGFEKGLKMVVNYAFGLIAFMTVTPVLAIVQNLVDTWGGNRSVELYSAFGANPFGGIQTIPYVTDYMASMAGLAGILGIAAIPLAIGVIWKGETMAAVGLIGAVRGLYAGNTLDNAAGDMARDYGNRQAEETDSKMFWSAVDEHKAEWLQSHGFDVPGTSAEVARLYSQVQAEMSAANGGFAAMGAISSPSRSEDLSMGMRLQAEKQIAGVEGFGHEMLARTGSRIDSLEVAHMSGELGGAGMAASDVGLVKGVDAMGREDYLQGMENNAMLAVAKTAGVGREHLDDEALGDIATGSHAGLKDQIAKGHQLGEKFGERLDALNKDTGLTYDQSANVLAANSVDKMAAQAKGLVGSQVYDANGGDGHEHHKFMEGSAELTRKGVNANELAMGAAMEGIAEADRRQMHADLQAANAGKLLDEFSTAKGSRKTLGVTHDEDGYIESVSNKRPVTFTDENGQVHSMSRATANEMLGDSMQHGIVGKGAAIYTETDRGRNMDIIANNAMGGEKANIRGMEKAIETAGGVDGFASMKGAQSAIQTEQAIKGMRGQLEEHLLKSGAASSPEEAKALAEAIVSGSAAGSEKFRQALASIGDLAASQSGGKTRGDLAAVETAGGDEGFRHMSAQKSTVQTAETLKGLEGKIETAAVAAGVDPKKAAESIGSAKGADESGKKAVDELGKAAKGASSFRTGMDIKSADEMQRRGFLEEEGGLSEKGLGATELKAMDQIAGLDSRMRLAENEQNVGRFMSQMAKKIHDGVLANTGDEQLATTQAGKAIAPFLNEDGSWKTGADFWRATKEMQAMAFKGSNAIALGGGYSAQLSFDPDTGEIGGQISGGLSMNTDNANKNSWGQQNTYSPTSELLSSEKAYEIGKTILEGAGALGAIDTLSGGNVRKGIKKGYDKAGEGLSTLHHKAKGHEKVLDEKGNLEWIDPDKGAAAEKAGLLEKTNDGYKLRDGVSFDDVKKFDQSVGLPPRIHPTTAPATTATTINPANTMSAESVTDAMEKPPSNDVSTPNSTTDSGSSHPSSPSREALKERIVAKKGEIARQIGEGTLSMEEGQRKLVDLSNLEGRLDAGGEIPVSDLRRSGIDTRDFAIKDVETRNGRTFQTVDFGKTDEIRQMASTAAEGAQAMAEVDQRARQYTDTEYLQNRMNATDNPVERQRIQSLVDRVKGGENLSDLAKAAENDINLKKDLAAAGVDERTLGELEKSSAERAKTWRETGALERGVKTGSAAHGEVSAGQPHNAAEVAEEIAEDLAHVKEATPKSLVGKIASKFAGKGGAIIGGAALMLTADQLHAAYEEGGEEAVMDLAGDMAVGGEFKQKARSFFKEGNVAAGMGMLLAGAAYQQSVGIFDAAKEGAEYGFDKMLHPVESQADLAAFRAERREEYERLKQEKGIPEGVSGRRSEPTEFEKEYGAFVKNVATAMASGEISGDRGRQAILRASAVKDAFESGTIHSEAAFGELAKIEEASGVRQAPETQVREDASEISFVEGTSGERRTGRAIGREIGERLRRGAVYGEEGVQGMLENIDMPQKARNEALAHFANGRVAEGMRAVATGIAAANPQVGPSNAAILEETMVASSGYAESSSAPSAFVPASAGYGVGPNEGQKSGYGDSYASSPAGRVEMEEERVKSPGKRILEEAGEVERVSLDTSSRSAEGQSYVQAVVDGGVSVAASAAASTSGQASMSDPAAQSTWAQSVVSQIHHQEAQTRALENLSMLQQFAHPVAPAYGITMQAADGELAITRSADDHIVLGGRETGIPVSEFNRFMQNPEQAQQFAQAVSQAPVSSGGLAELTSSYASTGVSTMEDLLANMNKTAGEQAVDNRIVFGDMVEQTMASVEYLEEMAENIASLRDSLAPEEEIAQ